MSKNIKVINQKIQLDQKKKVAAYARVSSGKDAMLQSLSAQISYYSNFIQSRNDWLYMGVYADEAKTGTKDNRPEFQRMLDDCKDGKINLIVTKSISRFARNTVTLLETVRTLKDLGVAVFFEEQNINTLTSDGELMLTILASYAQEESRSVSENCKWRLRDKMKKGLLHSLTIYGYKLVNGVLQVESTEAEIVKQIFADYLDGMGVQAIVNKLNDNNTPTSLGGEWDKSTVRRMLSNEKYTGNLLLQKTYISDHITKQKCFNKGELPMYYVEDSHEFIIAKEIFDKVQLEIKRRSHSKSNDNTKSEFTSKITCGICGKNFRRKINNAGTKYAKVVWICSTFNTKGKKHCASKQIPESILEEKVPKNFKSILVPTQGILEVTLQDDSVVTITWDNPSRTDSWTDEMKENARLNEIRRKNNG